MSLIDGLEDKVVDVQRNSSTPSGAGGVNRVWSTVLSQVRCKIAKPSEEYQRQMQGLNLKVDSVLYVVFGVDIREDDRIVNVFDEHSQDFLRAQSNGVLVPVEFLVLTIENPGGESDYSRCALRRWDGLSVL